MIGAITTIESGFMLLPQVIGIYVFGTLRRRKRRLIIWHCCVMLPFIFMMGALTLRASRLPSEVYCLLMLSLFAGFTFCIGIVVAVWMDWLAHLFETRIRGTVMGISWTCSAVLGALAAVFGGWLLKVLPSPVSYAVMYFIAGSAGLVSMMAFARIEDPAAHAEHDVALGMALPELLRRFRTSLDDANFRAFLVGRVLATAGFCVLPFLAVYYNSSAGGGLPGSIVVAAGAAMTLSAAGASYLVGRIGDRSGHRLGILFGILTQVFTLLVVITSRGLLSCLLAYAGAGACVGSGFISHFNMLFETCPHDSRVAHITIGNIILGTAALLFPLAGGWLAAAQGVRTLFVVSLLLSLTALVWTCWRVREPRMVEITPRL
jgi:MFS family permease